MILVVCLFIIMLVIFLILGNLFLFFFYDGIVDDNFIFKCFKRVVICGFLGYISIGWNKIKDIIRYFVNDISILWFKYYVRYFWEGEM